MVIFLFHTCCSASVNSALVQERGGPPRGAECCPFGLPTLTLRFPIIDYNSKRPSIKKLGLIRPRIERFIGILRGVLSYGLILICSAHDVTLGNNDAYVVGYFVTKYPCFIEKYEIWVLFITVVC